MPNTVSLTSQSSNLVLTPNAGGQGTADQVSNIMLTYNNGTKAIILNDKGQLIINADNPSYSGNTYGGDNGGVNKSLCSNGEAGLIWQPVGGFNSFYNVFYETKNYSSPSSGSTLILYQVSSQANIIPNLRTVINFNSNFSFTIAPQVAIFRVVDTDTSTELQSFRQTITGTTHQHIPLQFNFTMPDVYTLSYKIEITTVAGLSVISVDTDDYYSIIVNEIQPAP